MADVSKENVYCEESVSLLARLECIAKRAMRAAECVEDVNYAALEIEYGILREHMEQLDAEYGTYLQAHGLR